MTKPQRKSRSALKSLSSDDRAELISLLDELEKRKMEKDLIAFSDYFFRARKEAFVENSHHRIIADTLKEVEQGKIKNLLINIPPRYGKTELAVINWIAKSLAVNPKAKFIHLSYSDDLALDNSQKAKELIESAEFQKHWNVQLKSDSKSKKKWYTTDGGGLYATAAGGAVTGFGAGLTSPTNKFDGAIIIDDPLKVTDAESMERDKVNERLNNTIKSRRNSRDTPIIIIMQRIHEDDMSGFVMEGGMGEEFYHLNIPAITEGEALWPFKHTIDELNAMKAADLRTFSAQYLQNPTPDEGVFFKREWFKRYRVGSEPSKLTIYGANDTAVSEGKGDYTELGIAGFDRHEDLYLLDWWSGQTSADKWIIEQQKLVSKHDPVLWVAEAGVIRRSTEPFIKSYMRGKKYFRLEWIASVKDKAANARAFQGLASQGKVHIPNTPWGDALLEQLISFPYGKYDDKVDVCGLFGRILDQTYAPQFEAPQERKVQDGYGLDEDDNDFWANV